MQASVVAMAVSPPLASVALLVALVALLLDRCLPLAPPPGWADYACGWAACTRAVAQAVAHAIMALTFPILRRARCVVTGAPSLVALLP
jgi:hypothetical protein